MKTTTRLIHFLSKVAICCFAMLSMTATMFASGDISYDINDISDEFRAKYIYSHLETDFSFIAASGSGTCVSLEKSASFNDENGDGYAQVGETITYSFNVCNEGNVNLYNVTISDALANVGGTIPYLAWTGSGINCNSTTFSTNYTLGSQDILATQVINSALVYAYGPQGQFVSDISDDPNNFANIDINGNGNPDDPTITTLTLPPMAGAASVVWKDQNGNGMQDFGEPGVANVVVNLYDCIGNYIDSQTTDNSGMYSFSGLTPGQYQIQFDLSNLPPVCDFTYQNVGSSSINSDADITGLTNCFTVDASGTFEDIDAGLILLASLANTVWIDNDGDGVMDFGELPLAGVRVELYNGNDILLDYQFTTSTGQYLFDELYPGDYYLKFIGPNGYDLTFPNVGANDTADSDVDNTNGNGTTQTTNLTPGEHDSTWNAGFYEPVLIGDLVWYDTNKNDVFDDGIENGLNGIKVNIFRVVNGVASLYDFIYTGHKPGTPSDDGYWKLSVPPGTYYIEYDIPAIGLVRVIENKGNNDNVDSDVNDANGPNTTSNFTVLSGSDKCDLGAGFYPQATLGDKIWYDDNQNGIQDNNEAGVPGILVKLYDDTGALVSQRYTDANGEYIFYNLRCISYYVEVTPPSGFTVTQPNAGNDEADSDIDQSNGPNTTSMYFMESGQNERSVDGGIHSNTILSNNWIGLEGVRVNDANKISWALSSDKEAIEYRVERMFESQDFAVIGSVLAEKQSNNVEYTFSDTNARKQGTYYYRITQVLETGDALTSTIVVIEVGKTSDTISMYPNPARNEVMVQVNHSGMDEAGVLIIYNNIGEVILTNQITLSTGVNSIELDINHISPGIYQVQVQLENQQLIKKLIVIN